MNVQIRSSDLFPSSISNFTRSLVAFFAVEWLTQNFEQAHNPCACDSGACPWIYSTWGRLILESR